MQPACHYIALLALLTACGSGKSSKSTPPVPPPAPTVSSDGAPASPAAGLGDLILAADEGVSAKGGGFVVHLTWTAAPSARQYASATLRFADRDRKRPQSVSEVQFKPWMTSMGHGTAMGEQTIHALTTSATSATEPGIIAPADWRVEGIYFIMGGAWDLRITAKVNGVEDTAVIAVRLP